MELFIPIGCYVTVSLTIFVWNIIKRLMCGIREFTVQHLSLSNDKPRSPSYIKTQCKSWKVHFERSRSTSSKIREMGTRIDRVLKLFDQVVEECGFILAYNLMLEYIELKWGVSDDSNDFCRKIL